MMKGQMIEADFEKDEVTFRMEGKYFAAAGTYIILTEEEYLRPKDTGKTVPVEEILGRPR